MNSKRLPLISVALALAIPTVAIAAKPDKPDHAKGQAKPKNAVFKGTVVSTDTAAGTVTVHVLKVNHWSKAFKDSDVTFTVATVKKINVADSNADGKRDLADLKTSDPVLVQARITKDSAQPFAARKLNDLAGGDDADGSDES
jgi:hypothetical protein